MGKYDYLKKDSENPKIRDRFDKAAALLKEAGFSEIILFAKDGALTFGDPRLLLALYVHHDKLFNEETLPQIVKEIPEELVNFIVEEAEKI